jgi:[protein-PII] uridylyltransferase
LLCGLAKALHEAKAAIRSAHIATYGERAVDVFYLTGRDGAKITDARKLKSIQARLVETAREADALERAAAE